MANDPADIYGLGDLGAFNQSVVQNDPYGIAGRSLAAWQPNVSTWSPTATGLTAFTKSFMSGLLGNVAKNNAASALNSVIGVLPQLRSDPMSVATPEGVPADAFATLKGNQVLRNYLSQESSNDKKESRVGALLQSVLPDLIKTNKISAKDALNIATSDDPMSALDKFSEMSPKMPGVTPTAPTDNPLANGRDSTLQKTQAYFQQFLDSGMPAVQAAAAAKEQVKGEISSNNKSFDEAKAAREYGQNLLSIANTARAGIGQAGQTGPLNPLAKLYEYGASALGSSEATSQIAGDTLLNSIGPDVIKLARPTGGGATSDFESRAYLGSGPSTSNTPEANALLVAKMEKLGKLNVDYADFLEAYRDANAGSIVGAAKKWNEYKQAYPIFTGEGSNLEINESRPPWQEYFAQVGSGQAPAANSGQSQPVPTGQYTKSGKQIYILNGVKGVID